MAVTKPSMTREWATEARFRNAGSASGDAPRLRVASRPPQRTCPQTFFRLTANHFLYGRAGLAGRAAARGGRTRRGPNAIPRGLARPLEIFARDEPGPRSRAPR